MAGPTATHIAEARALPAVETPLGLDRHNLLTAEKHVARALAERDALDHILRHPAGTTAIVKQVRQARRQLAPRKLRNTGGDGYL